MRFWLGEFKQTRRRGRNWNIGIHVYEDEAIPVGDVIGIVQKAIQAQYPNAEMVVSPSVRKALID